MTNINWRLRLMNKPVLIAIIADLIAIFFTVIEIVQTFPHLSPEQLTKIGTLVVEILVLLGIVVDPTTEGIKDSEKALDYTRPHKDITE